MSLWFAGRSPTRSAEVASLTKRNPRTKSTFCVAFEMVIFCILPLQVRDIMRQCEPNSWWGDTWCKSSWFVRSSWSESTWNTAPIGVTAAESFFFFFQWRKHVCCYYFYFMLFYFVIIIYVFDLLWLLVVAPSQAVPVLPNQKIMVVRVASVTLVFCEPQKLIHDIKHVTGAVSWVKSNVVTSVYFSSKKFRPFKEDFSKSRPLNPGLSNFKISHFVFLKNTLAGNPAHFRTIFNNSALWIPPTSKLNNKHWLSPMITDFLVCITTPYVLFFVHITRFRLLARIRHSENWYIQGSAQRKVQLIFVHARYIGRSLASWWNKRYNGFLYFSFMQGTSVGL